MSDAKAQARQRAISYLSQLLQMNPVQEAEEIIRARSAALGLAKKSDTAPVAQPRAERQQLLQQLEQIRADFWTMPLNALQAKLSLLSGQGFPDVDAAIARLQVVAAHRGEFPRFAAKRGFDGDFFSSLKQILTRSPREMAIVKEQVLSSFRNRASRKRGRRMVQLLKKEMPAIYELETEWFEALRRQKPKDPAILVSSEREASYSAASTGSGASYWWVGIAAVIIGRLIASLMGSE